MSGHDERLVREIAAVISGERDGLGRTKAIEILDAIQAMARAEEAEAEAYANLSDTLAAAAAAGVSMVLNDYAHMINA